MFKQSFAKESRVGKLSFLKKFRGIFKPSTDTVAEPSVNKKTRGRPTTKSNKDKQVLPPHIPLHQPQESRRHSCSTYTSPVLFDFDLNERPRHSEHVYRPPPTTKSNKGKQVLPSHVDPPQQSHRHSCSAYTPAPFTFPDQPQTYSEYSYQEPASKLNDFFDEDPFMQNLVNYRPPPMQGDYFNWEEAFQEPTPSTQDEYYYQQPTLYTDPLVYEIPTFFQPYVIGIQDVEGDGNCGFRSVAVGMRRHQGEWPAIRRELLEELRSNEKYKAVYGDEYNRLEETLNFFGSGFAPSRHWMWMGNTGLLIANKYNCILHYLSNVGSVTFFPLWSSPDSLEENHSMTIAHVHGNHFVNVDLQKGHPMPTVAALYFHNKKPRKRPSGWEEMYKDRLLIHKQHTHQHKEIDRTVIECE